MSGLRRHALIVVPIGCVVAAAAVFGAAALTPDRYAATRNAPVVAAALLCAAFAAAAAVRVLTDRGPRIPLPAAVEPGLLGAPAVTWMLGDEPAARPDPDPVIQRALTDLDGLAAIPLPRRRGQCSARTWALPAAPVGSSPPCSPAPAGMLWAADTPVGATIISPMHAVYTQDQLPDPDCRGCADTFFDVAHVSGPDVDGMVTITGVCGHFATVCSDMLMEPVTPELADALAAIVIDEVERARWPVPTEDGRS